MGGIGARMVPEAKCVAEAKSVQRRARPVLVVIDGAATALKGEAVETEGEAEVKEVWIVKGSGLAKREG